MRSIILFSLGMLIINCGEESLKIDEERAPLSQSLPNCQEIGFPDITLHEIEISYVELEERFIVFKQGCPYCKATLSSMIEQFQKMTIAEQPMLRMRAFVNTFESTSQSPLPIGTKTPPPKPTNADVQFDRKSLVADYPIPVPNPQDPPQSKSDSTKTQPK